VAVNLVSPTTINRATLYRGQPGTSSATAYTVPASTDVKIAAFVLCNTTALAATVTVSVVASGGSASTANQVVSAVSVPANTTVVVDSPIYMTTSDFIAAFQGTAAAITVFISGETYA